MTKLVEREDGRPTVVLGVTGCIAAYKACELVRLLQKADVRVKVVMTEHATHFVDPLTFRALTHEEVAVGLFDDPWDPIHHISLAQEADVFCIAPCTGNVLAKLACGIADDLLTTAALAVTSPLVIAPAMNVHMYEHPATQGNLDVLAARGACIVSADEGYLACGDVGRGRLAEPAVIAEAVLGALRARDARPRDLEGVRVLVTAGPTVEPIDPVRFVSNRSSGKMGYALARAAQQRGAAVTLVSGPVALERPQGVSFRGVGSACDMLGACEELFPAADIAVFAAAVADYRPEHAAPRKLKKGRADDDLECIRLVPNPDILATMAARKSSGQTVIGFAAETEDVVPNAREKLARKGADMIVANQVGEGIVFGADTDKAYLVTSSSVEELPEMAKDDLAHAILDAAVALRA